MDKSTVDRINYSSWLTSKISDISSENEMITSALEACRDPKFSRLRNIWRARINVLMQRMVVMKPDLLEFSKMQGQIEVLQGMCDEEQNLVAQHALNVSSLENHSKELKKLREAEK